MFVYIACACLCCVVVAPSVPPRFKRLVLGPSPRVLPMCKKIWQQKPIKMVFQNGSGRFFKSVFLSNSLGVRCLLLHCRFDNAASDETVVTLWTSVVTLCCKICTCSCFDRAVVLLYVVLFVVYTVYCVLPESWMRGFGDVQAKRSPESIRFGKNVQRKGEQDTTLC